MLRKTLAIIGFVVCAFGVSCADSTGTAYIAAYVMIFGGASLCLPWFIKEVNKEK